jgi:hypothetical protein
MNEGATYQNQLNFGQQPAGQAMYMQPGLPGGLNQTLAIPSGGMAPAPPPPPGLPPNAS